jgi:hypothetical protein
VQQCRVLLAICCCLMCKTPLPWTIMGYKWVVPAAIYHVTCWPCVAVSACDSMRNRWVRACATQHHPYPLPTATHLARPAYPFTSSCGLLPHAVASLLMQPACTAVTTQLHLDKKAYQHCFNSSMPTASWYQPQQTSRTSCTGSPTAAACMHCCNSKSTRMPAFINCHNSSTHTAC